MLSLNCQLLFPQRRIGEHRWHPTMPAPMGTSPDDTDFSECSCKIFLEISSQDPEPGGVPLTENNRVE
jgi:hypothetical protein